jgi:aryl-alcohol dehydrogenase-like predicted oxidoreductase
MRYRPFGISGKAVSAISLGLGRNGGPGDAAGWRRIMFSGMELGVNCFDFECGEEAQERGIALGFQAVERRLIFLICTVRAEPRQPFSVERLAESLKRALTRTSAGYFDVVMFEQDVYADLTPRARTLLRRLRDAALVLQVGVRGDACDLEAAVADPEIDVLSTSFNLTSDWRTRRILREAAAAGMTVVGSDPTPIAVAGAAPQPKGRRLGRRERHNPLEGVGTYAFLHSTPNWKAEELCVAYALTEPAIATLQLDMTQIDLLETLCGVPERDPPTSLGAQVEMARFGVDGQGDPSAAPGAA